MRITVSLKLKIMGLVLITCLVLTAVSVFLTVRQNRLMQDERNNAQRQADIIAMQGSIERHQRILEKVAVNLLNTDELILFLVDQKDASAKMVIEGMFLSFEEDGIGRFILYDKNGKRVLEQSKDKPPRQEQLPTELKPIYEEASEDFNFHYYFRGVETSTTAFPVEYCMVTVVTDDDDNVIGFVELALDAVKWLTSITELTGNIATLYEPVNDSLTLTTNPDFLEKVAGKFIAGNVSDSFSLIDAGAIWILTDMIPIRGTDEKIISYLLISQDASIPVKKERRSLIFAMAVSAGIILCALLVALVVTTRGIIKPIEKVIAFARKMAAGHFVNSLEVNTGDEIAEMSVALNEMAERIRLRAKEAEAISTGDLSTVILVESQDDILGTSLKKIVDNLGEIINLVEENAESLRNSSIQVSRFTEEIRDSSETIKDRSTSISDGAEQISRDVERLASATEEMSASVREIGENTNRSKVLSTEANELSLEAGRIIKNLDRSAEKIDKASGAISDFADQTNLLALNATIEAARAGEAGKGFAVVASEVKALAIQSISTAKSIAQDIDEIQNHTGLVVQQTSRVTNSIGEIDESALVVSAALTEQAAVADDLAGTINGTYERVKTFTLDISDINDSISQNNDVIISLSTASKDMLKLAGRLKDAVGRFTLA